jgi:integrase
MPVELSAKAVAALPPRRSPYWVAPNLYANKEHPPGFWVLMYASPVKGRRVEMGLGSVRDPALTGAAAKASGLSVAEAKAKALEYRAQVLRGRCPLSERQAEKDAHKAGHSRVRGPRTFAAIAEAFIAFHRPTWSNKKHARQWASTLSTYAYPSIGHLPIGRVDVGEVMQILEPIWHAKPETASRVRARIETVIDYARARKWFTGENPARWKGHLDQLLPSRSRVKPVQHRPAMPWAEVPALYKRLGGDDSTVALALRYLITTALRTGAVRFAEIGEFDLVVAVHTVPPLPGRKTSTEFPVPLSDAAMAILGKAEERRTSRFMFSGARVDKPLSDNALNKRLRSIAPAYVVHGFRSSFRDWAADNGVLRELAEACLGHVVEGKVEAAYLRSTRLDQRRVVMQRWAEFITGARVANKEVKRRTG